MTTETMDQTKIAVDLAVIGTGMAGMAAAIFAASRGLSTVCVGKPSEISFSSGCLDLFSRIPATASEPAQNFDNPFEGIKALTAAQPDHPYARLTFDEMIRAFGEFTAFMAQAGIPYFCPDPAHPANQKIITPAGTLKPTWCVPAAMMAGTRALAQKQPVLIVDIAGLKGFGARQMAEHLGPLHPELGHATIAFPGRETSGDLMCERLTWDLETPKILDRFIDVLKPLVKGYAAVGLPAILGIYRFEELRQTMESALGVGVFEIPTLAPSVTGMRTREAFLAQAGAAGIRHFPVFVDQVDLNRGDAGFGFTVTQGLETVRVQARYLLLASGRFLGRGLGKGEGGIKEMLLDLPVTQPSHRGQWFQKDFFDPRGHALNRAGIETDDCFRPLGRDGRVFHPNLHAAGSVLAHQDWKRERSGAGISLGTAFKAVAAMADALKKI